ncbi:TrkA family potassium uptake protein [Nocardioides sp. SYSU D00038]|uniref:potassium channel family protein n=1 Tax=Nocardioides sp. SYSU D00038 TaxID=2812554 RepID=UPI00196710A3|nr:potassium channel protein [Nocardioides sp. SYSU D00038]
MRIPLPRRAVTRIVTLVNVPVLRRAAYHFRRMTGGMDSHFFLKVTLWLLGFLLLAALLVTLTEGAPGRFDSVGAFLDALGSSFYWAVTTVMGSGDSSFVQEPVGYVVSWLLVLFGVAIVASITGALVGFLIDYILKEGQGMGASGYRDHIVVCGWNATARELIAELRTDEYTTRIVVLHDVEKNPAGDGVYFVSGDITSADDLHRAGIEDAMAAVICPADGSNEADMKSILCVLAIESLAPHVRTVVEANNPAHVEHFQRADADEIVVSSTIVSRLMARSSLYPGLANLVTDIVSGGDGSELYRVSLPDEYVGLSVDQLSARLRADHRATLLSVSRGGTAHVNPPEDFRLAQGDDLVVVAESLGSLAPLEMDHDLQ